MEGYILVNKTAGITSHDVVDRVRKATSEKRVGHAGTLDPFATGLLVVGVGRPATREFQKLVGLQKEYEAVFVLGATTDTDDCMGKIIETDMVVAPFRVRSNERRLKPAATELEIKENMQSFMGEIEQVPPQYSAIKIKGQKMYESARKGKRVEAKPRKVTIYEFELLDQNPPLIPPYKGGKLTTIIKVRIACSSGTYIRAMARDMGGYVQELNRTKIGPFSISEATSLENIEKNQEKYLLPISSIFDRL
ncbi:MAG: tRNA pseudouridine(55) synthase TruB [Patescibacteria group bacterium]